MAHPFKLKGLASLCAGSGELWSQTTDGPREVQRAGCIKQGCGNVDLVLPGSPSALGGFHLVLRLGFRTSASLEKTWIG